MLTARYLLINHVRHKDLSQPYYYTYSGIKSIWEHQTGKSWFMGPWRKHNHQFKVRALRWLVVG